MASSALIFTARLAGTTPDTKPTSVENASAASTSHSGMMEICPPEAPMPTDALKARIDDFLAAHNTLALATGCGNWVRCTPLEYLRVNGALYILTEGGLKFKGIWWNGAISAAVYDSYDGIDSLAGLQMTGKAVYIDPLSDEYRSVIEARGVQLQQLQQMPAMLHAVRLDITRYELLDGALRSEGYAARQVLSLV